MVIHLVKSKSAKGIVAMCGVKPKVGEFTMWYTEATCLVCRPFEYVKDGDGELVKVPRQPEVESPPPTKVRVMKRLPKRT